MNNKIIRYPVPVEYSDYTVNSGFAKVKITVMTSEQIANGTEITKDAVQKRVKGLNYLPIVGKFEDGDFTNHASSMVIDEDGMKLEKDTRPYGAVIENSARYEKVKLKNGEDAEYLVVDAYLWIDEYPELEVIYKGDPNNQSMEISVIQGDYDSDRDVYVINDFEFKALCILGKDVKPAFHEAKVLVDYADSRFNSKYQELVFALDKYLEKEGEVLNLKDEEKKGLNVVEDSNKDETKDVEVTDKDDKDKEVEVVEETEEVEDKEVSDEDANIDNESLEDEDTDLECELQTAYDKIAELEKELNSLREFKRNIELKEKQDLIDSYKNRYQLTDKLLKDILTNIDSMDYELIEGELCKVVVKNQAVARKDMDFSNNANSALAPNIASATSNRVSDLAARAILRNRK